MCCAFVIREKSAQKNTPRQVGSWVGAEFQNIGDMATKLGGWLGIWARKPPTSVLRNFLPRTVYCRCIYIIQYRAIVSSFAKCIKIGLLKVFKLPTSDHTILYNMHRTAIPLVGQWCPFELPLCMGFSFFVSFYTIRTATDDTALRPAFAPTLLFCTVLCRLRLSCNS